MKNLRPSLDLIVYPDSSIIDKLLLQTENIKAINAKKRETVFIIAISQLVFQRVRTLGIWGYYY